MTNQTFDLIIFTIASSFSTLAWSGVLLALGWCGFIAFMALFSASCALGGGIHLLRTTGK